jgi:hypothetical protein
MFERSARAEGVMVQGYHSDNGVFTAKEFYWNLSRRDRGSDSLGLGLIIKMA